MDELVQIDTQFNLAEGCFFMNAMADQYINELYFHMFMSDFVDRPEKFDELWRCGGADCSTDSGNDGGNDGDEDAPAPPTPALPTPTPPAPTPPEDDGLCGGMKICWYDLSDGKGGWLNDGTWRCEEWAQDEAQ